jgi:hypothetical protein
MLNAIIVEGPDGAGKTTLITELQKTYGLQREPRAASSTEGPITDLVQYTDAADYTIRIRRRVTLWDRHPLISEPIYSAMTNRPNQFQDEPLEWLQDRYATLINFALVVWCLPPLENVRANVRNPDIHQLRGVEEQIDHIYNGYRHTASVWDTFPHSMIFDYTDRPRSAAILHSTIKLGVGL